MDKCQKRSFTPARGLTFARKGDCDGYNFVKMVKVFPPVNVMLQGFRNAFQKGYTGFPLSLDKGIESREECLGVFKPELITGSKILRVRGRTGLVDLLNVDSS